MFIKYDMICLTIAMMSYNLSNTFKPYSKKKKNYLRPYKDFFSLQALSLSISSSNLGGMLTKTLSTKSLF